MKAAFWGKVQAVALAGGVLAATATGVGWGLRPGVAQEPKAKPAVNPPIVNLTGKTLPDPDEPEKGLPKIDFDPNANRPFAPKNLSELSPLAALQPGEPFNVAVAKMMHRTAMNELTQRLDVFTAGARGETIAVLLETVRRVRDSELALSSDPSRQLDAWQRFHRIAAFIVSVNRLRYDAGQVPTQDLNSSRYLYLEAVLQVSQAAERAQKGR